ncbi:MAG TPA: hypothetical protein VMG63_11110 [Terriglobia bacterium]|nr:hypothetical protein [Terriglobia bacterium]
MSKVPSLSYDRIVRALTEGRMGTGAVKGKPRRLQKRLPDEILKVTVPAHRPVKRSTLAHILKEARLDLDTFLALL